MDTRPLGRTGLQVPPLCLGTMTFGLQCDEPASFAILDRASRAASTSSTRPTSIRSAARATRSGERRRSSGAGCASGATATRIVLATKCAGAMGPGPNDVGLSR